MATTTSSVTKKKLRKPLIMALEPRVLLDGAALATGAEMLTDLDYKNQILQNQADKIAPTMPDATLAPTQVRSADPTQNNGKKEVVFVDSSVQGYQTLIDGVGAGIEIQLIDGSKDGLAQINTWAQTHMGYDAIHILSHGSSGNIHLGTTSLTDANLSQHTTELTNIGNSLTADGDILVYGCNVANGEVGKDFIGKLAQATGADIAASDDATGSADKGGDWVLERHASIVEATTLDLQNYSEILNLSSAQVRIRADDGLGDYSYTSYVNVGVSTEFGTSALNPLGFSGFTADIDPTNSRITVTIPNQDPNLVYYGFDFQFLDLSVLNEISSIQYNAALSTATGRVSGSGTADAYLDKPNGIITVVTLQARSGTLVFDLLGSAADTTPPTVSSVAITSATGAQNSTLNAGDVVTATVTMDEATTVTGTPQLALNIGGTTVQANYASGSGTTALTFTYTIQSGQTDANGISIAANALTLNGGTLKDAAGNNATLTLSAVTDNASYKVDTTAPTESGSTSSNLAQTTATISSTSNEAGTMYYVIVPSADSAPSVAQVIAGNNSSGSAATKSGNGAVTANTQKDFSITGLTASTAYKAYFVTVDAAGNQSSVASTTFTTTSPNAAPTVSGTPADVSVTEDTASNFDLSAVTVADTDGDNLTVTLTASAGTFAASTSGSVTVGGSGTDTLTLAGTAANINTWLDTASNIQYTGASNASGNDAATFTLKANDGTVDSTVANGNIDITDVNPAITAGQSFSVDENSNADTAVGTVAKTGDTNGLIWSITGGTGSALFDINSSTGAITVKNGAVLDYETATSYTLTVAVDDEDGDTTADSTQSVTVNLNNVNEIPVVGGFDSNDDATFGAGTFEYLDYSDAGAGYAFITDPDLPTGGSLNGGYLQISITTGTQDGSYKLDETSYDASTGLVTGTESVLAGTAANNLKTDGSFAVGDKIFYLYSDGNGGTTVEEIGSVVTDGSNGSDLKISFTTNDATAGDGVNDAGSVGYLTRFIKYSTDTAGVRVFSIVVNDGTGTSAAANARLEAVDNTAPTLSSSTPADNATGIAPSANITLTFNETIVAGTGNITLYNVSTGVTVETFNIANGVGSAGGTASISGSTLTLNPNANLAEATQYAIQIANTAIKDAATNAYAGIADNTTLNFTTGVSDSALPVFQSIQRTAAENTNAATLTYTLKFNEAVTAADTTDFELSTTGDASGTITGVTGSGTDTLTVTVGSVAGTGKLGINLKNTQNITDVAGNALANGDPADDEVYNVDRTLPTLLSINRSTSDAGVTGATSLEFIAVFSEPVSGLATDDFALTGTASGTIASISGNGTPVITITVNGISGNGSLGLALASSPTITDGAGNSLTNTSPSTSIAESYTIDTTAPTAVSILRTGTELTTAGSVTFDVVFSETVANVTADDFELTGTASGSIASISGSGSAYTVTVNSVTGDGTLGLKYVTGQNISDAAGNSFAGTLPSRNETYTIDNSNPAVSAINRAGVNQIAASTATDAVFTVVFNESVSGLTSSDFTVTGTATNGGITSVSSSDGKIFRVTVGGVNGTVGQTVGINFTGDVTDRLSQTGNASFTTGQTYTIGGVLLNEGAVDQATLDELVGVNRDGTQKIVSATAPVSEVVIIDSRVPGLAEHLGELRPGVEVWMLDAGSSALNQISDILAQYNDLTAIHLISHGSSGAVYLGAETISNATLANQSAMLANWGNALTDSGDFLIYGCDVAKGDTGIAFVNAFAAATGADVAASDDLTGASWLGGDWVLEYAAGTFVPTTLAFSPDYSFVLGVIDITEANDTYNAVNGVQDLFKLPVEAGDGTGRYWAYGGLFNNNGQWHLNSNIIVINNFDVTQDKIDVSLLSASINPQTTNNYFIAVAYGTDFSNFESYKINLTSAQYNGTEVSNWKGGTSGAWLEFNDDSGNPFLNAFFPGVSEDSFTLSNFILPSSGPSAPSTPDMSTASDTGTSSTDNITKTTTPTFTGTGATAGATVKLYDTNGTTVLGTATADASGNWSITSSALSAGSHTLTAKQTVSGTESSASSSLSVTIDTTASTASVTTATIKNTASVTTAQNTEAGKVYLVNSTATVTDMASLDALVSGGTAKSATNTANSNTTIAATGLADGTYKIYAIDTAGNVSSASTNSITVDTTAPTESGSTSSNLAQTTATISSTSNEAGTMYYVIVPSADSAPSVAQVIAGNNSSGSAATKSGNGAVTANTQKDFNITGLTASTSYKAYFVTVDAAGNQSSVASASFTTTSPNTNPTISDVSNQTTNEGTATSGIAVTIGDTETDANSLTLSGTSNNTTLIPNANIVVTGTGANRTVTITPATNQIGTATITLTVTDANGGTATDTFTVTVDDVNPAITDATASVDENATAGTAVTTVTATGDTNGLTYSITGGTGSSLFEINSTTGAITVKNGAVLNYEATNSYTLNVAVDDEDADATADSTATITVNLNNLVEIPALVSSSPADNATGAAPTSNVVLTFDENISLGTSGTITLYDITGAGTNSVAIDVSNHSGQLAVSGKTLTINPSNDLLTTNQYAVRWTAGALTGTAGNPPALSDSTTLNFATGTTDTLSPTVTIVDVTDPASTNAGTVTINFSEQVQNVDISDFTLTRDSNSVDISALTLGNTGSQYTIDLSSVTATAGTYVLTLNPSNITDTSGNALTAGASETFVIDKTAPTSVAILRASANPMQTGTASFTVAFSEGVTGVTADDFTLTGTATSGASVGTVTRVSDSVYTVTVTGVSGNGTLGLDLKSSGTSIADVAGNAINGGKTGQLFTVDNTAPTAIAINRNGTEVINGTSASFTVSFDEAVTGVDASDFTLDQTGGMTGDIAVTGSGSTYTVTLNNVTGATGTLSVDLKATGTGIVDVAGNAIATGFTNGDAYTRDTTNPTITASQSFSIPENMAAGYVIGQVSATDTNGVVSYAITSGDTSGFFAIDANGVITLTTAGAASGAASRDYETTPNSFTLGVTATDAAGNTSTSTNVTINLLDEQEDSTPPTATVTLNDTAIKIGDTATVTITFSEAVTGFTTADLTAANGTLSNLSSSDGGITWTATLTPTANIEDSSNVITLDKTGVTDLAGNAGVGTTDSSNYAMDTVRPSLASAISISDTALKIGDTATVTFTFAEAVTGFTVADLTAENGTLSNLSSSDGGITWTATLTPTANIEDSSNIITLDKTGVTDLAGNAGVGTTDSGNYAMDTGVIAPSVALTTDTGSSTTDKITSNGALSVTGTETGASVEYSTDGTNWNSSFTPVTGSNTVYVRQTDVAGNVSSASSAYTFTLDTSVPTLTSTTRADIANPTTNSFSIEMVYSDATGSGIDSSSIATSNITVTAPNTIGTLTVTGATWDATTHTATYTVSAPNGTWNENTHAGSYTVALNANQVKDLAGNAVEANNSAKTFNVTFNTAPVITSNAGGATASVDVVEKTTAVTTLTATDVDNHTITYSITGGADQTAFNIDANTGALTFATAPTYQTGGDNDREVIITANDGHGGTDTQTITVNILSDVDGDGVSDNTDPDKEGDGILNSIEDQVPGANGVLGDGNGDGIADSTQSNVLSMPTTIGSGTPAQKWATFSVPVGVSIKDVTNSAATGIPRNAKMPVGQFDFTLNGVTPGGTVQIDMYVDKTLGANGYFKKAGNTWTNIGTATTVGDKTKISFSLTDGGIYDADGIVNGVIKDPGGAVVLSPQITSNGGETTASFAVNENQTTVTTITATTPPLSSGVTYSISGGADQALFSIDPTTGVLTFLANRDFESKADSDQNNVYEVAVTANDGQGNTDTQTLSVSINNVAEAPTGTVTITGTATQGETLTASNTLADSDGMGTVSYQWYADGQPITGATGVTFTLGQDQVGKTITVTASYTDGGNTAESVSSGATAAVVNTNDAPTGTVTINGTPKQGETLTASNTLADADGMGTVSYQWYADGQPITGATGDTFTLGQDQVGKTISVKASYTDQLGTSEQVSSTATNAVANTNDAPTGTVTITGTATQGETLTASNTLADADGMGTVSYQWYADGQPITGATGDTFTLGQDQVGKTITVTASYTDGGNTAESVSSGATAAVVNTNDAPTGTVTISGTPKQGETLTASNTLADADGMGTVSYQWYADGQPITGATRGTLTLGNEQVGKTITVKAIYTDGQGTVEQVSSNATASVDAVVIVVTPTTPTGGSSSSTKETTSTSAVTAPITSVTPTQVSNASIVNTGTTVADKGTSISLSSIVNGLGSLPPGVISTAGGGASSVLGTTGFMNTANNPVPISPARTDMNISNSPTITQPNTPMALTTSTGSISVNVGSNGRVEFARETQPSYQNVGLAVSSIQKSDGSVQVALIDAKPAQSYDGKQADGKDLPDWVKVDPTTGAITATPPAGQKAIVVNITAKGDGKPRVLQVEVKFTDDKRDKGKGDNAQPAKGNKPQASAGEHLTFSQQVDIAYNDYYGKSYGDRLIAALMG